MTSREWLFRGRVGRLPGWTGQTVGSGGVGTDWGSIHNNREVACSRLDGTGCRRRALGRRLGAQFCTCPAEPSGGGCWPCESRAQTRVMVGPRYLHDEVGHGYGAETRRGPGSVPALGGSGTEGGPATGTSRRLRGQARPGRGSWRPSGRSWGVWHGAAGAGARADRRTGGSSLSARRRTATGWG